MSLRLRPPLNYKWGFAMYKLTSGSAITRLSDGASIPADEGNRDYQEYLTWLDAGNTPAPIDPEPVPTYAEALRALNATFYSDRAALSADLNNVQLLDGEHQDSRTADLQQDYADLLAQYDADVAALKSQYGVS